MSSERVTTDERWQWGPSEEEQRVSGYTCQECGDWFPTKDAHNGHQHIHAENDVELIEDLDAVVEAMERVEWQDVTGVSAVTAAVMLQQIEQARDHHAREVDGC